MTQTPNHGYNVPAEGITDWHEPLNENFERYDRDIELRASEEDLDEYEPLEGAKLFAIDTGVVYLGDGEEWQPMFSIGRFVPPDDEDNYGSIAFGAGNTTGEAEGATVSGGGFGNTATGDYAVVSGGANNEVSAGFAAIGGGGHNDATEGYAVICGGRSQDAGGSHSFIGGGHRNEVTGAYAVVGGGRGNDATGDRATVAGGGGDALGHGNEASGNGSFVGGGNLNEASATYATIAGGGGDDGGDGNTASGVASAVGGGNRNSAADGFSTVAGGWENIASGEYSAIGGGRDHDAAAINATIGGGWDNEIPVGGRGATVAGGERNEASGEFATVCGGGGTNPDSDGNEASGRRATVGGGNNNTASGRSSFVGGGSTNEATGRYAAIAGGRSNEVSGDFSFAAGQGAKARTDGSFVWGGSDAEPFESQMDDTFLINSSVGINQNEPLGDFHIRHSPTGSKGLVIEDEHFNRAWWIVSDGADTPYNGELAFYFSWDAGSEASSLKAHIDPNAGLWVPISDRRLKHGIERLDGVLEDVLALQPSSFLTSNQSNGEQRSIGFIAQEVADAFPELISQSGEEGYLGLKYGSFSALSIQAIKEQQAHIEAQADRIADLEADRDEARDEVAALKAKQETLDERVGALEARLEDNEVAAD